MNTNKRILGKIAGLGLAVITALSSISCGKEVPMEEKQTRIDARSGILEVDTYYKNGVKDRQIIQGNAEVRFYTMEVDSVRATSLQENTTGRVNGWIVEPMNEGDSFVYYPETDSLRKESISEIATEGLPEIWKEVK